MYQILARQFDVHKLSSFKIPIHFFKVKYPKVVLYEEAKH